MKLILIILSFIAITFGQVPPDLIPPEKPPKPIYLRYNCTIVNQQFNSTIDFLMTDCSCGCSSQYFICSPSIINNYCCQVTNCKKERFQRCFRQQVECNSIWLSIELQPIGYPDVPKNLTLKKEYYNNCACGDQGCNNKISSYKNRDHIECWTDGTNILLELEPEDESGGKFIKWLGYHWYRTRMRSLCLWELDMY